MGIRVRDNFLVGGCVMEVWILMVLSELLIIIIFILIANSAMVALL